MRKTNNDPPTRDLNSAVPDERESSEESKMWTSLTEEQKMEVLQSYDESEDDSNLISDYNLWKRVK